MPDRQVEKKLRHAQQYGMGKSLLTMHLIIVKALLQEENVNSVLTTQKPIIDHDPEGDSIPCNTNQTQEKSGSITLSGDTESSTSPTPSVRANTQPQ